MKPFVLSVCYSRSLGRHFYVFFRWNFAGIHGCYAGRRDSIASYIFF